MDPGTVEEAEDGRAVDPVRRLALLRTGGAMHRPAPLATRPHVSVVIPCYNYGRYLRESVASALDQAGVEVDVIIVDDASTDDSAEIAQGIADADRRVTVIPHARNWRHLATYNDGFAAATGEYLVQLSADDVLSANALTRAVALLEAHPDVGFAYGRAVHFVDTPPAARNDVRAWISWPGRDWIAARCRSGYNVIQTTEVVMRTELVHSVGGYRLDLPHSGDLELWMRLATEAEVGFVAGPDQAFYRLHDEAMHTKDFRQGTVDGQFVDMQHRYWAFAALFETRSAFLDDAEQLQVTARRTFAREALERANYAFARGFEDFDFDKFEAFASQLDPSSRRSGAGLALAGRHRHRRSRLPLHPLWAPRAVAGRLENLGRRWRRDQVGV